MSDRGYKVVYKSRASDSTDDQLSPHRSRRDYRDDKHMYRDSRDNVSTRSEYGSRADVTVGGRATKTTYQVGRDRNEENYIKNSNVIVIDSPRGRDRGLSEWEVISPERNADGAYVIDMGSSPGDSRRPGRRYDYEIETPGRNRGYEIEALGCGKEIEVLSPPLRRDRSTSRGRVEGMQQVQIIEDYPSEDDRRGKASRRGRSVVGVDTTVSTALALQRVPTAVRHDHSPESVIRRRSRSIGFLKDQVSHHDATERRHERPGSEAHIAGKYLVGHRGEYIRDDDESDVSGMRRRRAGSYERDRYGDAVENRRERGYTRDDRSYYEQEYGRERENPSQRSRPKRHHHHHRDDDDESRYSEYYDKKTTKHY